MYFRILLICLTLVMAGCAKYEPVTVVDPSYQLPSKSAQKGIVAFSTQCQSDYFDVLYLKYFGSDGEGFFENDYSGVESMDCDSTGSSINYYFIQLPIGHYHLFDIAPPGEVAKNFKRSYFDVKAGLVTYAGRIVVVTKSPGHHSFLGRMFTNDLGGYQYGIMNASKKDIPYFQNMYFNVPSYKYRISLMRIK